MRSLINIFWLGTKELRSLQRDIMMVVFVVYAFTLAIYTQAKGTSTEVNNASIAFVDEDQSALSKQLIQAFYPPRFKTPELIAASEANVAMDRGRFMFVVAIPPHFENYLQAGRKAELQVNIDATAMQQASIGSTYIQNIINDRISSFLSRSDAKAELPVKIVIRKAFNPNGETSWFTSIVAIINQITLLTVVLTGAALIREREHGTIEHLLVMPVTPPEIMIAKIWANGLVIVVVAALSLWFVVHSLLRVPLSGPIPLFIAGTVLYEISVAALGILLATFTGTMGQFGLLVVPVLVILNLLSGSATPPESMPPWLTEVMQVMPTPHFVSFAQAVLYRAAGLDIVWPQLAALAAITTVFFGVSLMRFRTTIASFG